MRVLEKEDIQLVMSDVKLPDSNGIELTAQIKKLYPLTEVVVLIAYGTIQDGVKAIKNGAFDYLTKGEDTDKIIPLVNRAVEKTQLQQRVAKLEKQIEQKRNFGNIIGQSSAFREAVELARKVDSVGIRRSGL